MCLISSLIPGIFLMAAAILFYRNLSVLHVTGNQKIQSQENQWLHCPDNYPFLPQGGKNWGTSWAIYKEVIYFDASQNIGSWKIREKTKRSRKVLSIYISIQREKNPKIYILCTTCASRSHILFILEQDEEVNDLLSPDQAISWSLRVLEDWKIVPIPVYW